MDGDGVLRVDRIRHDDGSRTVRAVGEIDLTTAAGFEDALLEAARNGDGRLRVDLTGVSYFGSEGVRSVVRAFEAARSREVTMTVECSPPVRRVLEVTGLAELAAE